MRSVKKSKAGEIGVGFIGFGRVGSVLAVNCSRLGYRICGFYDTNRARRRHPEQVAGVKGVRIDRLVKESSILFLTVPDQAIKPVYRKIRRRLRPQTIVVHCAGSFGVEVFDAAREYGLETLALHPIQTLVGPKQGLAVLPGSYFALDGTKAGLKFGRKLVRQLRGRVILVPGKDRPLYHAMCVFASNFINGLLEAAEEIGKKLGFSRRQTIAMLLPLIKSTLNNIRERGALASLTGPVKRGDRKTVARHIQALKENIPELVPVYRTLTRRLKVILKQENKGSRR
jgi:predicted short-subunit dehydrogenase-like oxidoreductase (DUF2520 family)